MPDSFLRKVAAHYGTDKPVVVEPANGHYPEPDHPLVKTALDKRLAELSATPAGSRNDALNAAAAYLGRFPVDRDQLRAMLLDACAANGLLEEDGHHACDGTISSGLRKADADGPRVIEERVRGNGQAPPPEDEDMPPQEWETVLEEDLTPEEQQDLHQLLVGRKAYDLRILDEARALWSRQRAAALDQQPPNMVSMTDFLAIPDEPACYRVNELLPVGGRALLAAQYKAGKTSLIANLLRTLVDGDPFLGKYSAEVLDRILLIDTELDERMLRRWLREQGIRRKEAVNVLCLRGRLSSFAITDDRNRAEWAQRIDGAELIILDCLRPCLDALGLSEDKEAGIFLTAFDALCRECGAGEAVVVHHMGHSEERSRGDSRLKDWPDVLWKLVRDQDEDGHDIESGDRFFSAMGRDVNVAESQLYWQSETRALSICGGNRNDKKASGAIEDIIDIMMDPANKNGLSRNALVVKLQSPGHGGHGRNVARNAVVVAVQKAILVTSTGPRNSNVHILNPSHRRENTDDQ